MLQLYYAYKHLVFRIFVHHQKEHHHHQLLLEISYPSKIQIQKGLTLNAPNSWNVLLCVSISVYICVRVLKAFCCRRMHFHIIIIIFSFSHPYMMSLQNSVSFGTELKIFLNSYSRQVIIIIIMLVLLVIFNVYVRVCLSLYDECVLLGF